MTSRFDHVIIGAGIVGSCTAWQLAKRGKNVLLLEQFHLPHTRGSSHGQTRLIRSCYEEKHFAAMMKDAFAIWKQIENDSHTLLIQNTKVLFVSSDKAAFEAVKQNMEEYAPESLQSANLKEWQDLGLMTFPQDSEALLDTSGGVIFAHKAVTVIQSLIEKLGGAIRDGCPVTSIENVGDDVKITTSQDVILTSSLVVCAGPWTSKIFNEQTNQILRRVITAQAVKVFYWPIIKKADYDIPSFLDSSDSHNVYAIAAEEYPGMMKVCPHGGVACDPDRREEVQFDVQVEEKMKQYIQTRVPMLKPTPCLTERCMYTRSLDENFIIDRVPNYKNVIVGTGFSGTGFKTAPAVGKLLSEMALGLKPSHDISVYALSRFDQ